MTVVNPIETRAHGAVLEQDREAAVPAWPADPGAPDPRALAVAAALQRELPEARVLLFGSRARDDWHAESDIDLMIIAEGLTDARRVTYRQMGHQLLEADTAALSDTPLEMATAADSTYPTGMHSCL